MKVINKYRDEGSCGSPEAHDAGGGVNENTERGNHADAVALMMPSLNFIVLKIQ